MSSVLLDVENVSADSSLTKNEYSLLASLALLPSPGQLQPTYSSLLTPLLTLLASSFSQLNTKVKRALHQHTFLALSAYANLDNVDVSRRWDDIIVRRSGSGSATLNVNALKEGLHSLRAVCLRSFPEFLADVKMAAVPPGNGEIGTDVADITRTVSDRKRTSLRCD